MASNLNFSDPLLATFLKTTGDIESFPSFSDDESESDIENFESETWTEGLEQEEEESSAVSCSEDEPQALARSTDLETEACTDTFKDGDEDVAVDVKRVLIWHPCILHGLRTTR